MRVAIYDLVSSRVANIVEARARTDVKVGPSLATEAISDTTPCDPGWRRIEPGRYEPPPPLSLDEHVDAHRERVMHVAVAVAIGALSLPVDVGGRVIADLATLRAIVRRVTR